MHDTRINQNSEKQHQTGVISPSLPALGAPGLSTAHSRPHLSQTGKITYYKGANRTVLTAPATHKPSPGGGGPRGEIREFSRAARRRMMGLVNSIDYTAAALPYFVTLTYHNTWPEDPRAWKEQLKTLKKRMERLYGGVTIIWRLEYQKRGAPHFHLLLWVHDLDQLVPGLGEGRKKLAHHRVNRLRNNIAWMWNQIADPSNHQHLEAGTNVSECKKLRHLNGYLSKYVAKVEKLLPDQPSPGKMWGKMHADWLPISPVETPVEYHQFLPLRRILRRYSNQRVYCPAPKPGQDRQVYGMSCFVSDTTTIRLLAWLGIIGSDGEEAGYLEASA